jgi:hypothetical protein
MAASEAARRWEARRVDQLSAVNNLLIALATGLLAVAGQLLFAEKVVPEVRSSSMSWTLAFVAISITCGVGCSVSRLLDFRLTACLSGLTSPETVARKERLRWWAHTFGGVSWALLWLQLATFGAGAAAFGIVAHARTLAPGGDALPTETTKAKELHR